MNDTLRQKLREIIVSHGRDVGHDAKRCKALLLDYGGEHCREIFALVAAVEERVPERLLAAQNGEPLPGLILRLTHKIAEPRAMEMKAAQWAVESWAFALDIPLTDSPSPAQTKAAPAPTTVPPSPDFRYQADALPRPLPVTKITGARNNLAQPTPPVARGARPVIAAPPGPPPPHYAQSAQPNAGGRAPVVVTVIGVLMACCLLSWLMALFADIFSSPLPPPAPFIEIPPITLQSPAMPSSDLSMFNFDSQLSTILKGIHH